MSELLDRMESSYYPAFRNMFQDVLAALEEAKDINIYLKPLERLFEGLESAEFGEIKSQIALLMHTVCLLWANSKYYNTPARVIVLIQEICNLLIQQARSYLNPEDILKGETEESLSKVQGTLDVLQHFRETYEEMKGNLGQYQKNGQELKAWDFSPAMVFTALDNFSRRVQNIENLLVTALDMMKLEKIEFGGIRGKMLSQQVLCMYEEFLEKYRIFTEKSYDCLDTTNQEFEADVFEFMSKMEDMDRRLGSVFCQAFDDASGLEHAFKVSTS
ncbi:hypothetical protein AGOR_G00096650 [Albula goreensis]|uniref:Dynein heavy chain tail domain-containing protein n=1 Tax=Albula goreensis TaxID=1534307 RepID=A0A8T3DKL9_9TELE|nr:hypothetical protein AGOR_G00096650 [Albula goreensis]